MYKLLRWYNQNRRKILTVIIAIIFLIAIIQIFNQIAKQENRTIVTEQNKEGKTYENESKSIISESSVSNEYSQTFGSLIDNFLENCINNNYEKAYELLSSDCKNILYPDINLFKTRYCQDKFNTKKTYSFKSWTATDINIYQIKIFEDILSTGIANTSYIEDYYSVVYDNGEYKLNINNYIGNLQINQSNEESGIRIKIENVNMYMDYDIYNITILNNTDNTILLYAKNNSKSIYMLDDNSNKHISVLNENASNDFIIESNKTKKIKIKFSNTHMESNDIQKVIFSDIVPNYDKYLQDKNYKERVNIEVEI